MRAVESDGQHGNGVEHRGLKVVELADDVAGEMTGKLLAQFGATVIKVEPVGGSPTRRMGPFVSGLEGDSNSSLTFWYYNTSKQSVVLDLPEPAARRELNRMLAEADVVILPGSPAHCAAIGLEPQALSDQHGQLIVCAISPFGQNGPWSSFLSSDLIALAAGGLLNSCGYDDHTIPPIRPAENQSDHLAATFAQISILLALIERDISGSGQVVDLSVHDSVAVSTELASAYWFYPGALVQRQTCRHAQPTPAEPAVFPTRDGRHVYFALILADSKPWNALVSWIAEVIGPTDLSDPPYSELAYRIDNMSYIQQLLGRHFLEQDAEAIYREGQARGLPVAVINSPDEVLQDKHLAARGFFEQVAHQDAPSGSYPGTSVRFSTFEHVRQTAAPRLGEHSHPVATVRGTN